MSKQRTPFLSLSSMLVLVACVFISSSINFFDTRDFSIEEKQPDGGIPLKVFFLSDIEEGDGEELVEIIPIFFSASKTNTFYLFEQVLSIVGKKNFLSHDFNYYHSGISPPLS